MIKSICLVLLLSVVSWAQTEPVLKVSEIQTAYVPIGFDSNDKVQMVAEGFYRDTCSRPAGVQAKVNSASKTIYLNAMEYRYSGPCLDMIVPHDEVVDLGVLPTGTYQVVQGSGRFLGRLTVAVARTKSPDDFLYAPVSQAYVKSVGGKTFVTLSGTFTSSCMSMKKVVTHIAGNVVTVQPIVELIPFYTNCVDGKFPFEVSTLISGGKPGRYLLHVRSLNGNSINSLFDLNN